MSDYEDSGYDYSSNEDFDAVLARHQRRAVKRRFDDACMLCGYPDPEVAPILAKRNVRHVQALRAWSLALATFSPDGDENLVGFCPNHHWDWMNGYFTFVPSPNIRKKMREQEINDFERRQQDVNGGLADSGRLLLLPGMPPQIPYEFEYIPVTGVGLIQVHNETPSLPETFLFSTQGIEKYPIKKYPLRNWEISLYAVLLAAYQPLNNPHRFRSAQLDAAASEVTELVHMYLRPLTPTPSLPKSLSDQKITPPQADLTAVQTTDPAGDTMMQAREPPDEDVGQGSSVDTPTVRINDLGRDEDAMDAINTEAWDLPDSDDAPVVTPAVMASRHQWRHPRLGWGLGSMRFATSSDFIIDPDESQV